MSNPSNDDNDNNRANSMTTALCVIPPGPYWDTIQRARHVARDDTYHKWPPAIRLFHPFVSPKELTDVALEIAKVVEKYKIEPFNVVLNQWVILPHVEALEQMWLQQQEQIASRQAVEHSTRTAKEQEKVDSLIAKEERIGRQNLRLRQLKDPYTNHNKKSTTTSNTNVPKKRYKNTRQSRESPRVLYEKQKAMYEEFNGPCVVCLEPDQESQAKLHQLRNLLQEELFQGTNQFYSPTSSVSCNEMPLSDNNNCKYRPILPIGRFPTVTSAIEMARKLKGLWKPLHVKVTDLHLISLQDNKSQTKENDKNHHDEKEDDAMLHNREYQLTKKKNTYSSSSLQPTTADAHHLAEQEQFGCDAMVMLMGQEVEMDEAENEKIAQTVMRQGIPGGGADLLEGLKHDPGNDSLSSLLDPNYLLQEDANGEDTSELEGWLNQEDEEWDEGTVVVIGRTHFFTGEMRMYVGMPASSALDGKDRALGEKISGTARRRGSGKPRSDESWEEGEYGSRPSDNEP